jgi:hypothetical protein
MLNVGMCRTVLMYRAQYVLNEYVRNVDAYVKRANWGRNVLRPRVELARVNKKIARTNITAPTCGKLVTLDLLKRP